MSTPTSSSSAPVKDERERRRRIRESVRNFYEVEQSAAASPAMASVARAHSEQQQYQGKQSQQQQQQQHSASASLDLDSTNFNATAYTTALMRQSTLPKLLETDTVLRKSVKSLDKELQDLVYSNYSKFIAAAETIKEVRSSVNDMELKLQDLDKNVDEMERVSGRVTRELERHRHLVDQEVATNSMLRKVQFLVMLPQIMASAAQASKWVEAANFWAAGDAIFTRYAEFPSFVRTQEECRLKAEELYASVSQRICDASVEPGEVEGLKTKLAALKVLAKTSIDPDRLQQMGVQLIPPPSQRAPAKQQHVDPNSKNDDASTAAAAAAATTSPSRFTSDQVVARTREVYRRRLIGGFRENVDDAVAHIRLDFLHRKEDLDRHAKKVKQNLRGGGGGSNQPAGDVKAALVDLSLALRKRTISKLEAVIVEAFRNFATRMEVVDAVCGDPAASASSSSSSSASDDRDVVDILEPALARFLDEICTATTKWIRSCVDTFAECVVNAANAHVDLSRAPPIVPADIETTVNGMTATFFDAILDTDKTFCSISSRFLHERRKKKEDIANAAAEAAKAKNTSNNSNKKKTKDATSWSSDDDQQQHPDSKNATTTTTTAAPAAAAVPERPSAAQAFNTNKVSRRTEQLLLDLEQIFITEAGVSGNRKKMLEQQQQQQQNKNNNNNYNDDGDGASDTASLRSVDSGNSLSSMAEQRQRDDAELKRCNSRAVPVLAAAAVARACAKQLGKSDYASYARYLQNPGNSDDNSSSSAAPVARHKQRFIAASVSLCNLFVRLCGLKCLDDIRAVFFGSARFGIEAVDPTEPSFEFAVRIVTFLRQQSFVIQLLFQVPQQQQQQQQQQGTSSATTAGIGSTNSEPTKPPPLTAQFMRRDVTVGLKADMDRMFAARAAAAAAIATPGQQQQQLGGAASSVGGGGSNNSLFAVTATQLPDATAVCESLIMHVMTSLVETVREMPGGSFSKYGFQQLQVDASLLLHFFADLMSSSGGGGQQQQQQQLFQKLLRREEVSTAMVTEMACCAFDRTKDRTPLPNSMVEGLASPRWKIVRAGR